MIECPVCKHMEFVGSLYCSECGTRLVRVTSAPAADVTRERPDREATVTRPAVHDGPDLETGALIGLRVVNTGQVVSLVGRDNYTIGRVISTQAVVPDVDLSPFRAHEHGVSRLHAELHLTADGVAIVDLESANGTHINGRRLEPQEPMPLRNGDIIQLGSLSLQLISRYRG
jgi:pSer/pThr/pTyr-binding forkhead associated (FHA) protein